MCLKFDDNCGGPTVITTAELASLYFNISLKLESYLVELGH